MDLSYDSAYLGSCGIDGTLKILDLMSFEIYMNLYDEYRYYNAIRFCSNN